MEEFYKLLAERKTNFTWYILSNGGIRGAVKTAFSLYHSNEVCPMQAVCSNSYIPLLGAIRIIRDKCSITEQEMSNIVCAADKFYEDNVLDDRFNLETVLNIRKRLEEILFTEK